MRNITRSEQVAINQVARDTQAERSAVTTYKGDDKGLALFRMNAANNCREITVRHVLKMGLLKDQRRFLSQWLNDSPDGFGGLVRDFKDALERVTGRTIKL